MSVAPSHCLRRLVLALPAALLLSAHDTAPSPRALASISEIPIPGGLAAARQAVGDRAASDRALFLVELIERFYNAPIEGADKRPPEIRALLEHLKQSASQSPSSTSPDTVPLPLTSNWWIDIVFRKQARPETLVASILESPDAAMLYWGLLALDAPTREWLADRHDVIQALLHGGAPRFVVVAPYFRVEGSQVRVPGGDPARAAWKAVVGVDPANPEAFLRALVTDGEGRRANVFRSLSPLSAGQLSLALRLRDPDRAASLDALQRLYDLFARTGGNWSIPARPFFRQPIDPSSLIAEIHVDDAGRAALPGNERFWSAVFDGRAGSSDQPAKDAKSAGAQSRDSAGRKDAKADAPLDLVWLLDQVFVGDLTRTRVRTDQVLFAARVFGGQHPGSTGDVSVAVAGVGRYPALVRALERLHVTDPGVYRQAVERASTLDDISDRSARTWSIAQYQSVLALLVRAAARGAVAWADAPALISSLSAVETSDGGEYDGRLARWIDERLRSRERGSASVERAGTGGLRADEYADSPDQGARSSNTGGGPSAGAEASGTRRGSDVADDLLRLVAGPAVQPAAEIVWEDTRYRVDPAAAELARLERVRGDQPTPFLQSAWTLFAIADRIDQPASSTELTHEAAAFDAVVHDMGWDDASGAPVYSSLRYEEIARMLHARSGKRGRAASTDLVSRLRVLGDQLTARGLMELAYAAALGDPAANPITAEDAANRHQFGETRGVPSAAWRLPQLPADAGGAWRLEGSVLDLDVALAERWLTRVSLKPPREPPSLQRTDREAIVEATVILEPASLSDASRDTIAAAVRAGRARIAAVTSADLDALADRVPLDPVRRSLLPWVFVHVPDRLVPFFSTADLLAIGLQARDVRLDSWGASAWPLSGCPCLRLPDRRPRHVFTGHPDSGRLASTFPDLSLRLAEMLADLKMPAALLPGVLAAATSDLVDRAPCRYADDLRGLVEHVQSLSSDDLEQYLALLTTGGPLVLVREGDGAASGSAP
jgi:hypothetical protein